MYSFYRFSMTKLGVIITMKYLSYYKIRYSYKLEGKVLILFIKNYFMKKGKQSFHGNLATIRY
jgi:hypothetical protein